LYSLNEFTGFDRLQNANQLTVGLSSRLLRANNANNVLSAQIGFINYFTDPHVNLSQTSPVVSEAISPITGALTWSPNALWSVSTQAAWDTAVKQVNNAQIGTTYHFDDHHIILFNYQFVHGNSDTPIDALGFSTNASLLSVGLAWPITMHWNFIGYTYYDLTHRHPQNQYVGLSYDTCCWAVRMIVSDNFVNMLPINGGASLVNQYSSSYYVEFLLKGLGSAGNRRAEDMLTSTLPGFEDAFSNRGHYGYAQNI
jgi:LPS-assembly protein